MNRFNALLSVISLFAALGATASHAVPRVVGYAARVEAGGGAFNGTAAVSFRLFDAPTGGTSLWAEDVASVVIVDGELVHDLGSLEPLDDAILDRDALFLELTLDGEVLLPRLGVNAVPFALRAAEADLAQVAVDAERLGGRDAASYLFTAAPGGGLALTGTSFAVAAGGVTSAHLADGAVGTADLASGAVTTARLAAAAVTSAILADLAVVTAKVADGAVTLAKLAANSVDGSKIVDGGVGNADLASGAVTANKLAANAVTSVAITDGTVSSADLGTAAVTEAKIAAGAVTANKLRNAASLFDLPGECGEGLTASSTCRTRMCGVRVVRDGFNTILDVVPLFSDCSARCSATSSQTCNVGSTVVGVIVRP